MCDGGECGRGGGVWEGVRCVVGSGGVWECGGVLWEGKGVWWEGWEEWRYVGGVEVCVRGR